MKCSPKTQAMKRYQTRNGIAMGFYVAAILASTYALRHHHPGGILTVLLAVLPSVPIVYTILLMGLYLRQERDEFQRSVFQQCLLWGMGITLALTSVWGLLEMFTSIPHVPIFFTFPAFWFFVGVCTPFIRRQYRSSEADE